MLIFQIICLPEGHCFIALFLDVDSSSFAVEFAFFLCRLGCFLYGKKSDLVSL